MRAIGVFDAVAGAAEMRLTERPRPQPSINDVVVQVHACGGVDTELAWPATRTDRLDSDRTPTIPGHDFAGVITAPSHGITGRSPGRRMFALGAWRGDGALAESVAVEARNPAPRPEDVRFTVGASLPMPGGGGAGRPLAAARPGISLY